MAATTNELTKRQAFLVLNALPNLGPVALNRLLAAAGGDPRAVLANPSICPAVANWRGRFNIKREEERMARGNVDFITPADAAYPRLLREIPDPPACLYRRGGYAFEDPCLAVIGSRRTTLYGMGIARRLAAELARRGFCIVSGLARGIDTAAHEGALEAGGRAAAVLGTGIDRIYPPENAGLYRRVAERGAILTEFPLGSPATRYTFPMRNRIVSGMCAAVIVVESDTDGGAMITAHLACDQGRTVFAVPGRIDQPTSAGCHQLIRDGATLLTGVDDILAELSYLDGLRPAAVPTAPRARRAPATGLSPDEQAALACFDGGAILAADALAAQTRLSAGPLSAALMMLEIKRLIVKRLDGAYEAACS